MEFNRNLFYHAKIACLFLSAMLLAPIVFALPVLQINGDGQLTGANGVDVDGTLYNVRFVDGSCDDEFNGCDELSDFAFASEEALLIAAQALGDQVFIDGEYLFDSKPELTAGCGDIRYCVVTIPQRLEFHNDELFVFGRGFVNSRSIEDVLSLGMGFPPHIPLALLPSEVYAKFSPSSIPLPASVWLFLSAFGGLIGVRARSR